MVTPLPTRTPRPTSEPTPDLRTPWAEIACKAVQNVRNAEDAWLTSLDRQQLGDPSSVQDWVDSARDYLDQASELIAEVPDWDPGRELVSAVELYLDTLSLELDRLADDPFDNLTDDRFTRMTRHFQDVFWAANGLSSENIGCDMTLVIF